MSVHPELDFTPPSQEFASNFITPFKQYFHPEFFGVDEVDARRPAMFVSNHAVWGVLDAYPFAVELYLRKGMFLRTLADSNHFKIPLWRDFIAKNAGVVEASRKNCAAIMERKESGFSRWHQRDMQKERRSLRTKMAG
jgi:1-acyl-sn-glycerol-3-phosphate acyltransferase